MEKYIPKSAIVAEIEKLYKENYKFLPSDIAESVVDFKDDLLMVLDTLEVKEMDLEKEMGKYLDVNNIEYGFQVKLFDFAKHFFELGLKTQKQKGE